MKLLSFLTLSAMISISACSHKSRSCCDHKEKMSCSKEDCKKPCCDKDKKCTDGSCSKDAKADCKDGSCQKKS